MRKQVFGRRFKRDKNERKALFKGLLSSLVLYGKITTTDSKAKAIKGQIDKLVGLVKSYREQARPQLMSHLSPVAIDKIINNSADRWKDRQSGYTRIIRKGQRLSDNASTVIMQWVDYQEAENKKEEIKKAAKEGNKKKNQSKAKAEKPKKPSKTEK